MEYDKAFDEKQNKLLDDQSRGPGLYQMDETLRTNKPAFAWAPEQMYQKTKHPLAT